VAVPIGVDADDIAKGIDETEKIKRLAQTMKATWNEGWKGESPSTIETLPIKVTLENTLARIAGMETGRRVMPALGLDDDTLEIYRMDLQRQGPHLIIIGPPNSGKTTTLRTIVLSLASTYSAKDIMLVLIDFQRKFFDYGSQQGINLGQLPHVVQTINKAEQIEEFTANLQYECKDLALTPNRRRVFVLIDNYDSFSDEGYKKCRACFDALAIMLREYSTAGLHFIVAGSLSAMSAQEDIRKQVVSSSFGLALQNADAVGKLNGKIARSLAESEIPIGRGFIVKSGRTSMLQLATPYPSDEAFEASLDAWVKQIKAAHPEPQATWLRPPEPPKPPAATPAPTTPGASTAAVPPPLTIPTPPPTPAAAMTPEQVAELKVSLKGRGYGEALLNALGPSDLVRLAAKPKDGK
jgi:S-DNA-T family DNA segregation ATPase FtsK/SpoIIIE